MPPLPVPGEDPWGATLNAYLTALEERVLALENTPHQHVGRYNYNGTPSAPPASGQLRFNSADPLAATFVYINYTNADGTDVKNFWTPAPPATMDPIQSVYIQDRDDSSKWVEYTNPSPRTDLGTYAQVPIVLSRHSGVLPTQQVTVVITT
jgi:hypothetical protein